jgi:antitoxin (DNA-binding transcriptional repressor) of toxin-antitoxin stability system
MARAELTLSVTEFKAKCLSVFGRIASGEIGRVALTKHGAVIAEVTPPKSAMPARPRLYGSMRGQAAFAPGIDLTEPVMEGATLAEQGVLYVGDNDEGIGADGTVVGHVRADLHRQRRSDTGKRPKRTRAG